MQKVLLQFFSPSLPFALFIFVKNKLGDTQARFVNL
jgi:hypothetical protein